MSLNDSTAHSTVHHTPLGTLTCFPALAAALTLAPGDLSDLLMLALPPEITAAYAWPPYAVLVGAADVPATQAAVRRLVRAIRAQGGTTSLLLVLLRYRLLLPARMIAHLAARIPPVDAAAWEAAEPPSYDALDALAALAWDP